MSKAEETGKNLAVAYAVAYTKLQQQVGFFVGGLLSKDDLQAKAAEIHVELGKAVAE